MEATTQPQSNDAEETEAAEAVIVSGPLKGKIINLTLTTQGKFVKSDTKLTPEEMELLRAFDEASKTEEPLNPTGTTPDQPSQSPTTES